MFALIDCNNFFVSCERVFNPKLRYSPVIVLSNNDGCAISRSNEAKKLGIAMGAPLFKIKELVRRHKVTVLSSNFPLYGNLSARIMHIIREVAPVVEVYSIDEAFINLSGINNQLDYCIHLNKLIEKCTGIPVSIGIAKTRTLAKAANHIAKKQNLSNRVFKLDNLDVLNKILVGDIWGIGSQLERRLQGLGINTAAELIAMQDATIKQLFNIVVLRTVRELRGISCIELQDQTINKKQIMVSRSFGRRIDDLQSIEEALSAHVSAACAKLRGKFLITKGIYVFLNTGLHGSEVYKNSLYMELPVATNDTRMVIQHAKKILRQLFRKGYQYKKVGIILTDLASELEMQFDLFGHDNHDHGDKLMRAVDNINRLLGRNTIRFAASGLQSSWQMKSELRTDNYIGDWKQLPKVSIKI